jgi:hypothetical protein
LKHERTATLEEPLAKVIKLETPSLQQQEPIFKADGMQTASLPSLPPEPRDEMWFEFKDETKPNDYIKEESNPYPLNFREAVQADLPYQPTYAEGEEMIDALSKSITLTLRYKLKVVGSTRASKPLRKRKVVCPSSIFKKMIWPRLKGAKKVLGISFFCACRRSKWTALQVVKCCCCVR